MEINTIEDDDVKADCDCYLKVVKRHVMKRICQVDNRLNLYWDTARLLKFKMLACYHPEIFLYGYITERVLFVLVSVVSIQDK